MIFMGVEDLRMGIDTLIGFITLMIAGVALAFKVRNRVSNVESKINEEIAVMKTEVTNLKEEDVRTTSRIARVEADVKRESEKTENSIKELTKSMHDVEKNIIREIHEALSRRK